MKTNLNFTKNILLSNVKRLDQPYKLTFALTYWCNSRCKICRIWERKPKGELTTEEVAEFFSRNRFFNWIDITGGEVFLRKDLVKIVKTIIKTNTSLFLLHIPTNSLMPEHIESEVKKILALKPKRFIITTSLDGPKATHDELRGIPGNWEKVVDTYLRLKTLFSKNFDAYFGMTLSQYNYDKINQMYEELRRKIPDLTPNDIHFNVAHQSSHYYGNTSVDLKLNTKIIKSMQRFIKRRHLKISGVEFLERQFLSRIPEYLRTGKSPLVCQAFSGSFFLDSWGNIYPCAMWNKKIGNIKNFDYDLRKVWHTTKVKKTRKLAEQRKCPNCWTPCEAYQSILGKAFAVNPYKASILSSKKPTSS